MVAMEFHHKNTTQGMMMNLPARGPSRVELLTHAWAIRKDPLSHLVDWHQRYGDVVLLPFKRPTYLLCNPADVRHVLVTNQRNYHKTGGLLIGKRLFGQGLLRSEDPLHLRQRRIMQPMFHHQNIVRFGEIMRTVAEETVRHWKEGTVINLAAEMTRTTATIVGKSLFSLDISSETSDLHAALIDAQRYIIKRQRTLLPLPEYVPTPSAVRYGRAVERFDKAIYGMIASRRATHMPSQDMLSLLLTASDDNGMPMSDRQIRDELLTLLLAGHETTANALTWSWYLLSQHSDVETRLCSELEAVLHGRAPSAADVARLKYTAMVIAEAM
ncbi:MAG: cytochrome, partial [Bacteroidetes bacterium]|nr:cytochrome [Bacteroidota bacterium]